MPSPQKIDQDKKLYEIGDRLYQKKQYSDAAPYFEEIKNRFPQSPYSIESEWKLADSYFLTKEYASAQVEYESFRALHPTHEKIPYVYLQIGKCQLYQAPKSVQKDQVETEQGLMTLQQLKNRWGETQEAKDAEEFISKGEEKLAKKQMYVANFYIGQKKYFPALKRLENLNKDQTPQPLRREALYKLGYVHYKMKNPDIAKLAFEKVIAENIDDKYDTKSKSYLSKIK